MNARGGTAGWPLARVLPLVSVALVAAPALVGGAYSLAASVGVVGAGAADAAWSDGWRVLLTPETWRSLAWTAITSAIATLIALATAVFIGVRLRSSPMGRWLAVAPIAVPHVAAALAAILLLGQSGLVSRLAVGVGLTSVPADFPALAYNASAVALIATMAWKEFPFLALTVLAVLDTRGSALEESAQTLGATRIQAFRRITWPLLWRGVAPAVIAVYAFLLGTYEMPALLGPSDPVPFPVLTLERSTDPDLQRRGEAHVLALTALAATLALVAVHQRLRAASGDGD